jgi:chorismate mutase
MYKNIRIYSAVVKRQWVASGAGGEIVEGPRNGMATSRVNGPRDIRGSQTFFGSSRQPASEEVSMAKDSKSKQTSAKDIAGDVPGVKPEVVENVIRKAMDEGVSPETAKEIMREAMEEGTEPDQVKEVAEEAIEVEREDQEKTR